MHAAPSARERRELALLQQRRKREETGQFVAEGVRVVEDLLASSLTVRWGLASSTLEDGSRAARVVEEMQRRGIPLRVVDPGEFSRLADTETPQGVLAVAQVPDARLSDLPHGVVLVLDAVQDPGNFGSLVRSAEALGAAGVIALPGTVDPWNSKAVRSAVGSSFRRPPVRATWPDAERWLRENGYDILAAAVGGEPVQAGERVALVVGNEGAGISPEVLAGVDRTVGIPLRGRAESLNVTAAAAILLYELTR